MYSERLSEKPDSDLAGLKGLQPEAPDHESMDPSQMGTSEIRQPELSKSPSLDHYLDSPTSETSEASLNHYLTSESDASHVPLDDYVVVPDPEPDLSAGAASGNGRPMTSSPMEKPESKSFLSKVFSKVKFWRRISGPGSIKDAVNVAQRELRSLIDTGAYVSASSP